MSGRPALIDDADTVPSPTWYGAREKRTLDKQDHVPRTARMDHLTREDYPDCDPSNGGSPNPGPRAKVSGAIPARIAANTPAASA